MKRDRQEEFSLFLFCSTNNRRRNSRLKTARSSNLTWNSLAWKTVKRGAIDNDEGAPLRTQLHARRKRKIVITPAGVRIVRATSSRQGDDDDGALPPAFATFEGKWKKKMSLAECVSSRVLCNCARSIHRRVRRARRARRGAKTIVCLMEIGCQPPLDGFPIL